ncbi:small conductance mechanosensitive channel [Peribacillus deserti]|uniref:Small conductance mechanosensitive channel n=1 Tax=Peribacillus deserti TaxID=673318 RepID=A0ABS2QH19_9BACI|nr:mechanosensitive ion channel family protein [Peribacillus deserti]MBM7692448.1 small conductance mechanosensitive channel [Peribacillus deserti]
MNGIRQIDYSALFISFGAGVLKILAIIIIFYLAKTIAEKLIHKSFGTLQSQKKVSATRVKTLESLTSNIIGYVLIFILIVTILQVLGIHATAVLAGAGVVGLAVGFGAQGLVSDVVTGFFLLLERQVDVGDNVTIATFSGIVEQVGLRTTHIRGFDGTLHYIPNRGITNLSNHSRADMKAIIDFSIHYPHDPELAQELIQESFNTFKADNSSIVDGPSIFAAGVGQPQGSLRIIGKTVSGERNAMKRKLMILIKETLEANGLEAPSMDQPALERKNKM